MWSVCVSVLLSALSLLNQERAVAIAGTCVGVTAIPASVVMCQKSSWDMAPICCHTRAQRLWDRGWHHCALVTLLAQDLA